MWSRPDGSSFEEIQSYIIGSNHDDNDALRSSYELFYLIITIDYFWCYWYF